MRDSALTLTIVLEVIGYIIGKILTSTNNMAQYIPPSCCPPKSTKIGDEQT